MVRGPRKPLEEMTNGEIIGEIVAFAVIGGFIIAACIVFAIQGGLSVFSIVYNAIGVLLVATVLGFSLPPAVAELRRRRKKDR
jgi:hypothetical protein